MHSACARRSRGEVPLGRQADSMFVISWQGGITGEVTFGRQTEFTVRLELADGGENGGRGGVRYACSSLLWRAARRADS